MRIRLRRQVPEEENNALREHRARRKAVRCRAEREATGLWEPCRRSWPETDTLSSSMNPDGTDCRKKSAEVLFERFPKLKEAYGLSMRLTEILNKKSTSAQARLNLQDGATRWKLSGKTNLRVCWKHLKTTMRPSSIILRKGLQMPLLNPSTPRQRLSECSSEA